jgi:NAD(P)H-dependent flavin oxidoreductase YrpB (nitropropane dioxygenase family)
MNMIGAPKHVAKCLAAGVDIICAQGGEGGGHTGDVATSILIPTVVDLCRAARSPLTGGDVHVVAAGGIFDGRGLAAALAYGATAVWVGTRFICAKEAGAPPRHQQAVLKAGFHSTIRTPIYTGRPMRVLRNPMNEDWESKTAEINDLIGKGVIPITSDERLQTGGQPGRRCRAIHRYRRPSALADHPLRPPPARTLAPPPARASYAQGAD